MKKYIIFPLLLVLLLAIFIGLFLWGDSLNNIFLNEENQTQQGKENETQDNESDKKQNETGMTEIEQIKQECVELGCEEGSLYIGSKNSDKFYYCNCRWAETISPENIVCFETKQEALEDNRVESEC